MKVIAFLVMTLAAVAIAQISPVYRVKNKYFYRIQKRMMHMRISREQVADADSIAENAWRDMQICVNEYMFMRSRREYKRCLRSYVRASIKRLRVLEANHIRDYHTYGGHKYWYEHRHTNGFGHEDRNEYGDRRHSVQYSPTIRNDLPGLAYSDRGFSAFYIPPKPPISNTNTLPQSDEDDDDYDDESDEDDEDLRSGEE